MTRQTPTLTSWAREVPVTVALMRLSTRQVLTLKEPNLAAVLQEPPINLCMALLPTAACRSCLEREGGCPERVAAGSRHPSSHLTIKPRTIAHAHSPLLDQPMSTTSNQGIGFVLECTVEVKSLLPLLRIIKNATYFTKISVIVYLVLT